MENINDNSKEKFVQQSNLNPDDFEDGIVTKTSNNQQRKGDKNEKNT